MMCHIKIMSFAQESPQGDGLFFLGYAANFQAILLTLPCNEHLHSQPYSTLFEIAA